MKITIHRGIDQIGGCITEIQSALGTKILIDLGHLLPKGNTPSEDKYDAPENLNQLLRGVTAVFYTHYHGDHIGFESAIYKKGVDQYIGPVAKVVMMKLNAHMTNAPVLREKAEANLNALKNFKTYTAKNQVTIGDIKLTPFFVSHSAADAYMFLIECDGKKVLHTGDFREHGYLGKGLMPTINSYIKHRKIDVLISEGTMLNRNDARLLSEYDLQLKAKGLMKHYKNVFVLCSSTDQDRLASFYQATMNTYSRRFITDSYQSKQLELFTKTSGKWSDLYKFNEVHKFDTEKNALLQNMQNNGFTMMIRNSESFKKRLETIIPLLNLKETILIYSQFTGYINKGHTAYNSSTDAFVIKYNWQIELLHTSGHASKETLAKVCTAVNPKVAIIPIHLDSSSDFASLNISDDLKNKIITNSVTAGNIEIGINQKTAI